MLRGLGRALEARRIAGVREEPRLREQDSATWIGRRCGGNVIVDSALVDMYLKCSSPEDARRAPYGPPSSPGTASTGVAEALALFDQMTRVDGLRPNDVTFLAVLLACVHAWLVDQGLRHFSSMSSDYGLTLRSEHYAAAVDMLARVGRLRDAYEPAGLPGALGGPGRAARRWQEARRRESGRARRAALLPAAAGERRQVCRPGEHIYMPRARCEAAWPARTTRCGRWES